MNGRTIVRWFGIAGALALFSTAQARQVVLQPSVPIANGSATDRNLEPRIQASSLNTNEVVIVWQRTIGTALARL